MFIWGVWNIIIVMIIQIGSLFFFFPKIGNGDLKDRLERLIELRGSEGYLAECKLTSDGVGWHINEFHCSIRRIAEEYPVVCDQELKMMRLIFPDCKVERVQWRIEFGHSCGFHLQPTNINE